jgi:hypothetical protein
MMVFAAVPRMPVKWLLRSRMFVEMGREWFFKAPLGATHRRVEE